MYTDRLMANCWRGWFSPDWDPDGKLPAITLSFMPISHVMGRVILYSTLGVGGTAYFAARSDLSTLLDDLALVRPTKLDLVPRIWEMLFQEVQSEIDHRWTDGTDRDTVELQVMAEQREKLIGGRHFSAMTGSAPISPELLAWVEDVPRHPPDRGVRLDRGRHRPCRRPDPAAAGDSTTSSSTCRTSATSAPIGPIRAANYWSRHRI